MKRPIGYYFVRDEVDESFDGCWAIAIYQNGKGERWASRQSITREQARNITCSPFWWRNRKGSQQ